MRRITPERFYSQSWLETKEAERKEIERWRMIGLTAGAVLAGVFVWVLFGAVMGSPP